MKYNPEVHKRRSIRLKNYDYSSPGFYFITVCARDRECLFGGMEGSRVALSPFGSIVRSRWDAIPRRFPMVHLDEFIIMPNHIHGILRMNPPRKPSPGHEERLTNVGAPLAGALNSRKTPQDRMEEGSNDDKGPTDAEKKHGPTTIGEIVGAFKSLCVRDCLRWIKENDPGRWLNGLWQRNYWERIIRDEAELHRIREYIRDNPGTWKSDRLYRSPFDP